MKSCKTRHSKITELVQSGDPSPLPPSPSHITEPCTVQLSVAYRMLFLLLLIGCVSSVEFNNSAYYLSLYGYIQSDALTGDTTTGLKTFQEWNGLPVSGILDEDTVRLMESPRCGNKDELLPFTANPYQKWNFTVLTWYMYGSNNHDAFVLVQLAFNLWAKHTNLKFIRNSTDPTIKISFSNRTHMTYSSSALCGYNFDGPGGSLAHAYLPDIHTDETDIHIDIEESWDYTMNIPPQGKTSLYLVLIHEIGHALGLSHSFVKTSIMWAYSQVPSGIASLNEYDLTQDDIQAIQFLYGRPVYTSSTTTLATTSTTQETTTQTSTTTTTTTDTTVDHIGNTLDICSVKQEIDAYIIVNKRIYLFYRRYVWILSLNNAMRRRSEYNQPTSVYSMLPFLPRNFTRIRAVYQRPNREVVVFVDNDAYFFTFPTLRLLGRRNLSSMLRRHISTLNAVVNTYQGRTYIFTDNLLVYELDECTLQAVLVTGNELFAGVPNSIRGAFRYINGNIYFLTDSSVLEFSEFRGTVTGTYTDVFDILNIDCMREDLLYKLYSVVRYLEQEQ